MPDTDISRLSRENIISFRNIYAVAFICYMLFSFKYKTMGCDSYFLWQRTLVNLIFCKSNMLLMHREVERTYIPLTSSMQASFRHQAVTGVFRVVCRPYKLGNRPT